MARAEVRCGNVWLSGVADCGDLEWSTRWPGGDFEASWRMNLPGRHVPPFLRRGQNCAIRLGPKRIWRGELSQPKPLEDGGWEFVARGLHRLGERFMALTAAGASTSTPDIAIDQAIARGLPWRRNQSFSADPLVDGDSTEGLTPVTGVLDPWADEAGERWAVDADGLVYHAPDPTVPTWHLDPLVRPMGLDDGDYASALAGRYQRYSDGSYQTVWAYDTAAAAAYGPREATVDLTGYGPITTVRAQAIVDKILAKGRARLGWTDSIEAGKWELTTPGGVPADPRLVRAGQLVRQFGVLDPNTGRLTHVDFVIGETRYREGSGLVTLAPMDQAVSNLAEAIERATRLRKSS